MNKYKKHKDYHWRLYCSKKPNLYQKHVNRVINFFKDKRGKLLDVGCGDGLILSELNKNKSLECFGIDISQTGVDIANEKGVANCKAIDLFDFEGSGYDYIFLGDILEHLPDPERGLQKVRECLKSEGIVFIAVPMQKKKNGYDFHLFTKESVSDLIGKFFEILSFEERLDLKKIYFVARRIKENST